LALDAVEIVLEVEDTLGISLPDSKLERCRTPGDLAALVVAMEPEGIWTAEAIRFEVLAAINRITAIPIDEIPVDATWQQLHIG